jgi:thiopurine S-methyltransferase
MEIDFWLERWEKNQTGFHQHTINPYLQYFYGSKGPAPEKREKLKVFVPLCGKSRDMLWLAQNHYRVFGVECSQRAIRDFFEENALNYRYAEKDRHALYISGDQTAEIELFQGDFFALQAQDMKGITDVFDRASLIALPEDMRVRYAAKMAELQSPGTRNLLVSLSYDQSEMDGPPFSVTEENVFDLYTENFSVEKLCFKDVIADEPRFKERGLQSLVETVYKLVRK